MSTQEIIRDVPPEDVAGLIADYKAIGASASKYLQPNGRYTVVAVFEVAPQLAPLAMETVAEADPFEELSPLGEKIQAPSKSTDFASLAAEYRHNFDLCETRAEHRAEITSRVSRLMDNAVRYKPIAEQTNVPWVFIGIVHMLESNTNFGTHLHNGDPLSSRTVNVPAGRPEKGTPPFSWEDSAVDALQYERFTGLQDWNIATMLYRFERFNGMGYRSYGINSPYLWSYSNLYEKGRFVKDHVFDPEGVSKQCGAAVLLKSMKGLF